MEAHSFLGKIRSAHKEKGGGLSSCRAEFSMGLSHFCLSSEQEALSALFIPFKGCVYSKQSRRTECLPPEQRVDLFPDQDNKANVSPQDKS